MRVMLHRIERMFRLMGHTFHAAECTFHSLERKIFKDEIVRPYLLPACLIVTCSFHNVKKCVGYEGKLYLCKK